MPTFSHSRLSAFENCPLQYKYRYIDRVRVEPERETIEAFMGKRVHEALEKLYADVSMGRQVSKAGLLLDYADGWEGNWSDEIKVVRDDYTGGDYKKVGAKCLENYFDAHAPFDEDMTLAVEKKVTLRLGGDYYLTGVIDRLSQKGTTYEVHDYKTGGQLPSQEEVDGYRQLAFYQMAVHELWKDADDVELVWHYLRFGKDLRSRRSHDDLAKLREHAVALIKQVESTKDFKPKVSELCNWCAYKPMCPAWAHMEKVSLLPKNEFLSEPGVKLVNEYAYAKEEAKAVEEKLEKIEAALLDYSQKQGAAVIRGTDKQVSITTSHHISFPAKQSADRKKLEALLKESGLWDAASTLDSTALQKLLEEKKVDPKAAKEILSLATEQERTTVRLSKLKGAVGRPVE